MVRKSVPGGGFGMVFLLSGTIALAGCGSSAIATPPHHTIHKVIAPTATVSVSFAVAVTPRATAKPVPRPTPTATRFVIPTVPYLRLVPDSGPPVSEKVRVVGGNLPASSAVSLVWSFGARASSLGTDARTDGHGQMSSSFEVPASPPGRYRLTVLLSGVPYASSTYTVRSMASLTASVEPDSKGDRVSVRGSNFVPREKLLLVAYSTVGKHRPIVIGRVETSSQGGLSYSVTTRALLPGTYAVRAWTTNAIVALVGSTFVQVVA